MADTPLVDWKRLPKPLEVHYRWQEQGLCREQDPEMFFLPDHCRGEEKEQRILLAKKVCGACPVIEQCRKYAIETDQRFGVWGGLSEEEISSAVRRRKRYAGRKDV